MKIRGDEVLWLSVNRNVALTYAQFDLGAKYKVLRKVKYELENGACNEVWNIIIPFTTQGEALNYAKKINDCDVYS